MAGNAYLSVLTSGVRSLVRANQSSAGAGDAGKIVALNSSGKVDSTMVASLGETPSGTVNGVNAAFTLSHTPILLMLSRNGLMQIPGASNDYTISGATVTFTAGALPQTGDILYAQYLY